MLLSATMPTEILDVTKRFMREPIRILVKKEELTLEGIKQYYVNVEKEDWKVSSIISALSNFQISSKLYAIFTRPSPSPSVSSS